MATAKKAAARKAPAKKAPAKKAAAKKAAPRKAKVLSLRDRADRFVNIYLGVIGVSMDSVQDNLEKARKENEKRIKSFEKRGVALRKDINKRFDEFDAADVVEDAKEQMNKLQDQVEEAVESVKGQVEDAVDTVKDKLDTAKAA